MRWIPVHQQRDRRGRAVQLGVDQEAPVGGLEPREEPNQQSETATVDEGRLPEVENDETIAGEQAIQTLLQRGGLMAFDDPAAKLKMIRKWPGRFSLP